MNNERSLGQKLVDGMGHIPFSRWRNIVWSTFQEYKEEIWSDPTEEESPWFFFMDMIASKFGYFGNLDLYIEEMEIRLHKVLCEMKNKEDANNFIFECANHVEVQERLSKELTEYYGFSVIKA